MAHAYEIGTRAWQPDAAEGWVASELVDKRVHGDKVVLVFKQANGEVCEPWTAFVCTSSDLTPGSPQL